MIVAGCLALWPRALPAQEAAATPSSQDDGVRRDLDQLAATLQSKTSGQADRDEAARRLVTRGTAQASVNHELLAGVLSSGNHDASLAVARALSADPFPNPSFIKPLSQLLGKERALHDAAVRALAAFAPNPDAREALISSLQDPQVPVPLRAATARALSAFVDKRAAQVLVALLTDVNQGVVLQNAAADALVEMTGLAANGRDVQRWRQWSLANAAKPDAVWRADAYGGRAQRLDEVTRRQTELIAEVDSILNDVFASAPKEQKSALVMRYLNSPEPEVRAVGAQLVGQLVLIAMPVPEGADQRLRQMIGDSDPKVRLEVARALKARNYAGALDALLTQLAQEQDPEVKVAMIGAVATIGDVKAIPRMRRLIRDPSLRVATAAAEAIRSLGPALAHDNPRVAHDLAEDLWNVMQERSAGGAAPEFRAACIEALAPLHDNDLVLRLMQLLDPAEADGTRVAALKALEELGDPNTADKIDRWLLQEPSPSVRVAAIDALGKAGSFGGDAETLYRFMQPTQEADPAVRQRAWEVFQSLLQSPATSKRLLADWDQRFLKDPEHRIAVLLALNARLLQDRDLEDLAYSQQNTGETYVKLNQPDKAAGYFRQALDYWQSKRVQGVVTEQLIRQLLQSLLASKQYPEAIAFAQETIAANKSEQQTMGSLIRDGAEKLKNEGAATGNAAELRDAEKLIGGALKMSPPLDETYREDLSAFQREITQRLTASGNNPPP